MKKLVLLLVLFVGCIYPAKSQFQIGDIVQAKSGGPIMTVECGGTYYTYVYWFNERGDYCEESLHNDSLNKVKFTAEAE
jgi:uncharacterized protein YodC (DUF2158 family)